jgi:predicted nuclease of restriction endonuclease-like (RecB) superfamily
MHRSLDELSRGLAMFAPVGTEIDHNRTRELFDVSDAQCVWCVRSMVRQINLLKNVGTANCIRAAAKYNEASQCNTRFATRLRAPQPHKYNFASSQYRYRQENSGHTGDLIAGQQTNDDQQR